MTVNEIAEVVGKKERTVHGWIKTISAKNAQISAKIASSTHIRVMPVKRI